MAKRRAVAVVVLLVVGLGVWAWWTERSTPEVVRVYRQLRLGMTQAEVVAAFGRSSGHDDDLLLEAGSHTDILIDEVGAAANTALPAGWSSEVWGRRGYYTTVVFDRDGKAIRLYLFAQQPLPLLDRLRALVGG